MRCGWPLSRDARSGTGVADGGPCLFPGEVENGCTCSEGGAWNCTPKTDCGIVAGWSDPSRGTLHIDVAGVFWRGNWTDVPAGTWERNGSILSFRTLGSDPSCSDQPGRYALELAPDCSTFHLALVSDPCSGRAAFLDGFAGTPTP